MIPRDAIDSAIAKQVAALYGIESAKLVPVGGGFSSACIVRVEDSSGAGFALRRTPVTDAMPAERYCDLVDLLGDVHSRGCKIIPVPLRHLQSSRGVLETPQTSSFVSADRSQTRIRTHEFVWQLEPWMPGEPAPGPPTTGQVESALAALKLFHRTAAECVQCHNPPGTLRVARQESPGLTRRIAIVSELSSGLLAGFLKAADSEPDSEFRGCAIRLCAALNSWLPWLTRQLTEVAGVSYPLQPVIRDLWKPHVLFMEDRVTGVIDLNAMATDHVGLDVTRLFRRWFGADVDRVRDAISLFCERRSLDGGERRLVAAYDASTVLLSPVTWLRRRFTNAGSASVSREVVQRFAELTSVAERFEPL